MKDKGHRMDGIKLTDIEDNTTIISQIKRGCAEKNPFDTDNFMEENKVSLDLTYMFDTPEENSISRKDIESLIPLVIKAQKMLKNEEGDIYDGDIAMTGWQNLPEEISKEHLEEIKSVTSALSREIDAFVSIGIGGSYLGIEATFRALTHNYFNQLSREKRVKEEGTLGPEKSRLRKYASFTLIGAVVVVASASFVVESASFIAASIGVPPVVIGATVVAFGTSVPELATSISSVRKGHLNLALGNIVGSCFINITCILGVALLTSPLTVNMAAFSNLVMFSLITNLFLWYFLSSERLSWREGALLLVLYAVFLITSFGGYKAA